MLEKSWLSLLRHALNLNWPRIIKTLDCESNTLSSSESFNVLKLVHFSTREQLPLVYTPPPLPPPITTFATANPDSWQQTSPHTTTELPSALTSCWSPTLYVDPSKVVLLLRVLCQPPLPPNTLIRENLSSETLLSKNHSLHKQTSLAPMGNMQSLKRQVGLPGRSCVTVSPTRKLLGNMQSLKRQVSLPGWSCVTVSPTRKLLTF